MWDLGTRGYIDNHKDNQNINDSLHDWYESLLLQIILLNTFKKFCICFELNVLMRKIVIHTNTHIYVCVYLVSTRKWKVCLFIARQPFKTHISLRSSSIDRPLTIYFESQHISQCFYNFINPIFFLKHFKSFWDNIILNVSKYSDKDEEEWFSFVFIYWSKRIKNFINNNITNL